MSKREVDRVFDDIVDFSELEEFIDGPVKFYSSGMYVRLGFAVAVNMDPDVLVIDEVLAVGDERFQRKCLNRVDQFQREGRTILLVTHSADTVRSICDRGVVLSHGLLVADGEPGEATRIFRERLMAEGAGMSIVDPAIVAVPATPDSLGGLALPDAERPVRFRSVHRVYSGDNTVPYMRTGDDLTIRVEFEALYPVEDVVFSLEIRDSRRQRRHAHGHLHHRHADRRPPGHERDALRYRADAAARWLLHLRRRDPEPGRPPLRLAGTGGDVRGDEPGQDDRPGPHERARGAHLDRRATWAPPRWRSRLSKTRTMSDTEATLPADPQAYVEQVMAEIAEEVRVRRASGDLPPKLERELDELFLAHSPVAGRGGDLGDALRMVDAATFIDPVVPVESERAAGAFVKKGMRSLLLWYVGWVTHQMSQSSAAVSRALHIVDDRLQELERQVEVQRVPEAGVVEFPALARSGRLVGRARRGRGGRGAGPRPPRGLRRRVAGPAHRGGRRRRLRRRSPLPPRRAAELGPLDLRGEPVAEHLRAAAAAGLGAVVLSGTVEGMAGGERAQLLGAVGSRLAPGGTLVIHSVSRAAWDAAGRATGGRPRPGTAAAPRGLVPAAGAGRVRGATARPGPTGTDYLVTAVRASIATPYPPAER